MVKKRGSSKKEKTFEKRAIPKSKKANKNKKVVKIIKKSELKKESRGFFSKLFGSNSKKEVEKINKIKEYLQTKKDPLKVQEGLVVSVIRKESTK